MNVELILEWADRIEKMEHTDPEAPDGFCMVAFRHDCGTPSCIAGHVAGEGSSYESTHARRILGLTERQADNLFFPGLGLFYPAITPAQAARCMRHLAATGEVDWARACGEGMTFTLCTWDE